MLLQAVQRDERFEALYTVALATGMRPGELRALRWRDIDVIKGTIHVRATITRDEGKSEMIADRTKRGRGRVIAIGSHVQRTLIWHKTRQTERRLLSSRWQDHNIVFDRGDGHWLYQSHWLRRHRELCTAAGIPAINHHALRHTAATLMLEKGIPVKVVSEILGHQNIQTTLDIYAHVSDGLQRLAVDLLSDTLFAIEVDNIGDVELIELG
jgi:integrase